MGGSRANRNCDIPLAAVDERDVRLVLIAVLNAW